MFIECIDMNAALFDTLKMARRLEASGLPAGQAAGVAEAMAEAMSVADLATKADLDNSVARLEAKLDNSVARLEAKIDRAEADMRAEYKAGSSNMHREIALLRRDMEVFGRDLTIRLGGMMIAGFGLMLGAMRYMLAHP